MENSFPQEIDSFEIFSIKQTPLSSSLIEIKLIASDTKSDNILLFNSLNNTLHYIFKFDKFDKETTFQSFSNKLLLSIEFISSKNHFILFYDNADYYLIPISLLQSDDFIPNWTSLKEGNYSFGNQKLIRNLHSYSENNLRRVGLFSCVSLSNMRDGRREINESIDCDFEFENNKILYGNILTFLKNKEFDKEKNNSEKIEFKKILNSIWSINDMIILGVLYNNSLIILDLSQEFLIDIISFDTLLTGILLIENEDYVYFIIESIDNTYYKVILYDNCYEDQITKEPFSIYSSHSRLNNHQSISHMNIKSRYNNTIINEIFTHKYNHISIQEYNKIQVFVGFNNINKIIDIYSTHDLSKILITIDLSLSKIDFFDIHFVIFYEKLLFLFRSSEGTINISILHTIPLGNINHSQDLKFNLDPWSWKSYLHFTYIYDRVLYEAKIIGIGDIKLLYNLYKKSYEINKTQSSMSLQGRCTHNSQNTIDLLNSISQSTTNKPLCIFTTNNKLLKCEYNGININNLVNKFFHIELTYMSLRRFELFNDCLNNRILNRHIDIFKRLSYFQSQSTSKSKSNMDYLNGKIRIYKLNMLYNSQLNVDENVNKYIQRRITTSKENLLEKDFLLGETIKEYLYYNHNNKNLVISFVNYIYFDLFSKEVFISKNIYDMFMSITKIEISEKSEINQKKYITSMTNQLNNDLYSCYLNNNQSNSVFSLENIEYSSESNDNNDENKKKKLVFENFPYSSMNKYDKKKDDLLVIKVFLDLRIDFNFFLNDFISLSTCFYLNSHVRKIISKYRNSQLSIDYDSDVKANNNLFNYISISNRLDCYEILSNIPLFSSEIHFESQNMIFLEIRNYFLLSFLFSFMKKTENTVISDVYEEMNINKTYFLIKKLITEGEREDVEGILYYLSMIFDEIVGHYNENKDNIKNNQTVIYLSNEKYINNIIFNKILLNDKDIFIKKVNIYKYDYLLRAYDNISHQIDFYYLLYLSYISKYIEDMKFNIESTFFNRLILLFDEKIYLKSSLFENEYSYLVRSTNEDNERIRINQSFNIYTPSFHLFKEMIRTNKENFSTERLKKYLN